MKKSLVSILVIVVVALIVIAQGSYIVRESEQVIITQFGKPVGDAVKDAGIHFKIPFIQTANFFEKRYLEWDGDPNQVPTKDKKFIFVDTYARWQITDPLQFYKRLTNERGAQSRLDDILDGETRDFIANNYLEEAVRTSNRTPISSGAISEIVEDSLVQINVGRDSIQEYIQKSANLQTKDLGIEILDFRFKRINYVEEVRTQVYERMKSERFRIADKFRSEGQGEASRINGEKERELKSIQSEAFRVAEEIKGKADAEAAAIYSNAYNKNGSSRELYSFMKSMETFRKTFNDETTVILSTDSDLYKYLKSMQ
ncbi:protease modulator HflC [Marivirga arenosa]|jgi:membrane protease subunit HflC|uniref:Protein HflC n=1 Tax=Marivirga arenosa TaxID=3059076 RepID=A0AA51X3T6_9BACT|nr:MULTISPECIES: protease modulator HflC [unclassified Marivirga]WMN06934.1 protease modulator HflC [Marivirga sp. ABR2-2]WNB16775.1 protease modulator HflC [Marivirga sp. BKB1-2]